MIVVLAGGVGAARFLEGVVQVAPPEQVTAIVNTGDDMQLMGLHISPDIDIVTCTLAGVIDQEQEKGEDREKSDEQPKQICFLLICCLLWQMIHHGIDAFSAIDRV